ncbi:hypothetical protein GWO43_01840 [candidate division KSB1 bacterium]|nr:hypothetical protein [candidate division KSB1 bacterium]NIR69467.1 hypothetical protein [candidate division KSB1 bacterium]NIS22816.1 hypothetical protein [candidate division KSB1 bacterium]NIT69656.1 hypothetical protein [candidate division KSB1 bacterium]NIU23325.1 hypothetical protein [candidate division KSB1 bacterium]
MQKIIVATIGVTWLLLLACGTTKNQGSSGNGEEIKNVSVDHLSQPKLVGQYENQKVQFTAKFSKIVSGFDFVGMEQYQTTHFLVSLVSQDGKTSLPHVLVPTYEELLPTLSSNDLIQIEGVPHFTADGSAYIVVQKLEKL